MCNLDKFNNFMVLMKKKYETKFYILFFILKLLSFYPIFFFSTLTIIYFLFGRNFSNFQSICAGILAAIFVLYLLIRSILKVRFNFYLKRNIFKSFFAAMVLLKLSFNWKKFSYIDMTSLNIIKEFANKNLALQGSMSILWSNSNFYRIPNDIDFISMTTSNEYLLNNIDLLKDKDLKIEMNNLFYKLEIDNHKIEILQPKLFVSKFFKKRHKVFIPKLSWQVAMKYAQIFDCIFDINASQEKIKKSVIDLAFLLTDRVVFSKKILNAFVLNSFSNLFVNYFTNNPIYSFNDKEFMFKLSDFFRLKTLKILKENNLSWIYRRIFNIYKKIVNNNQIKTINFNMNKLLQNKDDLYKELLSFGNIKTLSSLKIDFDTKEKKNEVISKIKIHPVISKFLTYFPNLLANEKQIDIRYYLLSKLLKSN